MLPRCVGSLPMYSGARRVERFKVKVDHSQYSAMRFPSTDTAARARVRPGRPDVKPRAMFVLHITAQNRTDNQHDLVSH
jgi:hypothetical protein